MWGLLLSSTPSEMQAELQVLKDLEAEVMFFFLPSALLFILSPQIFSLTTSSFKNEIKKKRKEDFAHLD